MIVKFCDQHQQNDETVGGETWELTISPPSEKASAFEVDLCPDCSKPLRELMEHFDDIARTVKGGPAKPAPAFNQPRGSGDAPMTCPVCGEEYRNRSSLGAHGRTQHNKTLTELLGEKANYVCLTCEHKPTYGSGTGFSAHRRSAHGLSTNDPLLPGEVLADSEQTSLPFGKTGHI